MIISRRAKWPDNLHVHKTAEELARAGAQLFIDETAEAMRERGRFRVALSPVARLPGMCMSYWRHRVQQSD